MSSTAVKFKCSIWIPDLIYKFQKKLLILIESPLKLIYPILHPLIGLYLKYTPDTNIDNLEIKLLLKIKFLFLIRKRIVIFIIQALKSFQEK